MASKRIEYLDAVKGFAIFLVVLGHAIQWNTPNWDYNLAFTPTTPAMHLYRGIIWQLIYSFHMPLFFMLSGFFLTSIDYKLSGIEKMQQFGKTVVSKSHRLLIPFIVTGGLWLLVRGAFGYWFLFSLWELSLLAMVMVLILSFVNRRQSLLIDIIAWGLFFFALRFLLPRLPQNNIVEFDRVLFDVPAFIAGMFISKYNLLKYLTKRNVVIIFFVFLISFGLSYLPYVYTSDAVIAKFSSGLRVYIIPLCGSLAVIGLFKLSFNNQYEVRKNWIYRICSVLGLFSMEIYIVHIFFVVQNEKIGEYIFTMPPALGFILQVGLASVFTVIAVVASYYLARVLHRSNFLSRYLFGILPPHH